MPAVVTATAKAGRITGICHSYCYVSERRCFGGQSHPGYLLLAVRMTAVVKASQNSIPEVWETSFRRALSACRLLLTGPALQPTLWAGVPSLPSRSLAI